MTSSVVRITIGALCAILLIAMVVLIIGNGSGDGTPAAPRDNRAPIADAGIDRYARSGDEVILDGLGSDPEGGAITYAWRQTRGEPMVVLKGAASPTPVFIAPDVPENITLTFVLTVTDNANLSAEDAVEITVRGAPPSGADADGPPRVTDVRLGGNPWNHDGRESFLAILVHFSEDLIVRGTPTLAIKVDGVEQRAPALGHSGSSLIFRYEMEQTTTYGPESIRLEANALSSDGGSIRNARGEDADLNLSAHVFEIPERLPETALRVVTGTQAADVFMLHARMRLSLESIRQPTERIDYTWWLNDQLKAAGYYNGDPTIQEFYLDAGQHEAKAIIAMEDGRFYLAENTITVQPDRSSYDISLHGDNIIILDIPQIPVFRHRLYTAPWGWMVYTHFRDDFDFLIYLANKEAHPRDDYRAIFEQTNRSGTAGIAARNSLMLDTYGQFGSEGALEGVIHFASWQDMRRRFFYEILLHEIIHNWANEIIPPVGDGHFRFSSTEGVLGGFRLQDLRRLPQFDQADGEAYTAGVWFPNASPYARPRYGPIELYLAGLIPIDEVPEIWSAPNGYFLTDRLGNIIDEQGFVFIVPEWEIYTPTRIIEENGHRQPQFGVAQTEFKAALILLTDDQHPATEQQLRELTDRITQFSTSNPMNRTTGDPHITNFYEATGMRARLRLDNLAASRKTIPSLPQVPRHHLRSLPIRSPAHPDGLDGITNVILHGKRLHHH